MGTNGNNGAVTPGGKAGGVAAADEEFGDDLQWNGQPPTDRDIPGDF